MKQCVMNPVKACDQCGACEDRCELDPNKVCDNCFKCLDSKRPFAEIPVSGVYFDDDYARGSELFSEDTEDKEQFVLDLDESWREPIRYSFRTLPRAQALRVAKRKRRS